MNRGRNVVRAAVAGLLIAVSVGVATPAQAGPGRDDFTGDGKADLMALYDYGNGEAGLFAFAGGPVVPDNAAEPYWVWHADPRNFWPSQSKITAGDFTGDGLTDVLAMYDYGNGQAGMGIMRGTSGSGPDASASYQVWETPPGNFWLSQAKITMGDFTGDGKEDVLALYDYGNESAGLWIYPGTTESGPHAAEPYMVWETGPGGFDVNRAKISAGDFNLDGRDDLIALYDYGNAEAALFVFPGVNGSGTNATNPQMFWSGPRGSFNVSTCGSVDTDDIDGDGVMDFICITGGGIYRFSATNNGSTHPQIYSWSGTYAPAIVGDYDGNGIVDVITLVDEGNGAASLWVLAGAQPPNQIHLWVRVWRCPPGNFWPSVTKVA